MTSLLLAGLLFARQAPAPAQPADSPAAFEDRAEAAYGEDRLADAMADFDRLKALVPDVAPYMWQRGVTLYELGRFAECATQFASYHEANPRDLESVVWHFLCNARGQSPDRAKAALLKPGSDPRIMREQIYEMVVGRMTPDDVLEQANESVAPASFYAELYVGLYLEALGDRAGALTHLRRAASPDLQDDGGFLNIVAHVHLTNLERLNPSTK
jgi:lipoprotein NlpI